ncbi:hypothetical protein ESY86_17440 [Subsaximicrobium wynnwilliamsii]|uniref:HTTM-like domain-containing protein n=1 Tax=Subsaximicrobium wynnwilliamsii TaxID=291179 RepID=A0A5C6ZDX7_9FLAO|nr:sporulation-delaying protein SdpB family protein [Subsaximicrobium wynnwilliamsii]TXD80823.1 hypothetical protein ESY87_20055 [Subsaximicrobium wynnwilliamsii]TXD87344.1 hypothetical protein ESY86_17440 [Subsaximicrobium wynnwilliamsii]TXE00949.1 hypothetical protein ESY88_17945 [Subsaximicrobium wynnwilliamsii]
MTLTSYNIARTFLAFGLLITLIFNSNYTLFGYDILHLNNPVFDYNFYYILREHLVLAKILSIIILLIVISGYFPRYSGILHWYITYSFFMSSDVADGGDHIASNITLLLIPLTLLDNRKNHWSHQIVSQGNLKLYLMNSIYFLIAIQICAIYLHAFIGKLFVEEWKNGTAIYYWMTHNHFGINPIFKDFATQLLSNKFIVIIISWSTLALEFLLASCIILSQSNKKRYIFLFSGILFHFGIMLIHGLVSFFFIMSAALFIYLMPKHSQFSLNQLKNKKIWKQFINQFLH